MLKITSRALSKRVENTIGHERGTTFVHVNNLKNVLVYKTGVKQGKTQFVDIWFGSLIEEVLRKETEQNVGKRCRFSLARQHFYSKAGKVSLVL